jgi:cytochrome c
MRFLAKLSLAVAPAALLLPIAVSSPTDANRGRELFEKRCTGCHALDHTKAAPPLRAIFGRPSARDPVYPYSDALKHAHVTWDTPTLDKWLADPDQLVPGNDMSFGLEDPAERAAIVAWLKQLN